MNLFKKSKIFNKEESSYLKKNSKYLISSSLKKKNRIKRKQYLEINSNIKNHSYDIQNNNILNDRNKFEAINEYIKNLPNKSQYRIYHDNLYKKNNINNYNYKNSFHLNTFNPSYKIKKIYQKKAKLDSIKGINLDFFDKPNNSYSIIKNKTFSNNTEKIKRNNKNICNYSTFSFKKRFESNNSVKNKNNNSNINNSPNYVYNDKIHVQFSKSFYKYKYIKRNLYLACLKNMNDKKNIFNLSPNQYNEKIKLFSPLNTINYNREIKNLGNKFITKNIIYSNNKYKSVNKNKDKEKNLDKKTSFIEKIISYKILNQVKFCIKSPSDRAKCQKFINKWYKFEELTKM